MPIYNYRCEKHGDFEVLQKSDKKLLNCPDCGRKVKRLVGKPSIRFKGKGFYSNSD